MKPTKTRKSSYITIKLLSATAALVAGVTAGCGQTTTARCVDSSGRVLPDSACQSGSGIGYYGGTYYHSHWAYGGMYSGGRVTGYSTTAPASGEISTPGGHVVRGGFGGFGHGSFGGFGHGSFGGHGG